MSIARRMYAAALLPYLRLELPGWGRVLRGAGILDDRFWAGAPTKRLRGKLHGCEMVLDLSNWSERQTYYLGRFYDLPMQLLVKAALREGDTFVDVGANVGMITLLAARRVGPRGVVHAFEPNPLAFARLGEHVRLNQLQHVRLHNAGLADEAGEFTLSVAGDHTGVGTLAPVIKSNGRGRVTTYQVSVGRGDDVLGDLPAAPVMIKIDVEGFECRVLKGMTNLLRRDGRETLFATEAVETHLRRAGASREELFSIMRGHGYRAFALGTRRARLRHRLALRMIEDAQAFEAYNIAWLLAGGEHERRLRDSISAG